MAINSSHVMRKKIEPKASSGTMSQSSSGPSHVMTLTITTTQSSINGDSRCRIGRKKGLPSPYLTADKVKLSRVTEKKMIHKKPLDHDKSVPLATDVYRANSDELRFLKHNNKKVKKSVLTLPNESNAEGIVCTVSDVNDMTEFNKDQRDRERKIKNRKRLPIQTRKPRIKAKDFEYYDRDARYCSQMNIDLDCSSTDMIKYYNGDGKRVSNKYATDKVSETESKLDPHDVWAVLRNINRFQFTPSPPLSNYSVQSRKKKRMNKKRNCRKDARVIETCRTEEFAYISSYDVSRSRTNFSQASSIDRITVIDKQDDFNHLCQEFEKKLTQTTMMIDSKNLKGQNKLKSGNQPFVTKRNNKLVKPDKNTKIYLQPKERGNQLMPGNQSAPFIDKKPILNIPNGGQRPDFNKDANESSNAHKIGLTCLEFKEDLRGHKDLIDKELQLQSPYNTTLCSVNSGSSKAGLNDFVNRTKAEENNRSIYSDESYQQMKGITKVVLSKAPDAVVPKRNIPSSPIRKPRLVTTMPSTMPPKLTLTEIKRRLAYLRFPIVVLEKDELGCSSIEVPSFEPVQFRGLDQHIWPFMVEWQKPAEVKNKSKNNNNVSENIQQGKGKHSISRVTNNNNSYENKALVPKEKKFYIYNTKKTDPKRVIAVPEAKAIIQQQIKSKPIKQFKDKMLKLLYKNSTEEFRGNNNQTGGQGDVNNQKILQHINIENPVKKVDAATDARSPRQQFATQSNRRALGSPQKERSQVALPHIHPWAKGKWASDFIDSVIKKVKSGIYYTQEKKVVCKKCCKVSKEVSIQTTLSSVKCNTDLNKTNKIDDMNIKNDYQKIPGFDEVLAPVEIKSLNMKQITVKHCLTNVLLQFDVSVPNEKKSISLEPQRPPLYTPLGLTDSHSKIIKCKTTILNAIMPAELCSIIPKLMRNIDLNTNSPPAFPPFAYRKPEIQLSTISELAPPQSIESIKYAIMPFSFMSTKLRAYLAGRFQQNRHKLKIKLPERKSILSCCTNVARDMLKGFKIVPLLSQHHIFNPDTIDITARNLYRPSYTNIIRNARSKCMALQPYSEPKQCVAPTFGIHNVIKLLQQICCKNIVVNFDFPKYFPVQLNNIKITVLPNAPIIDTKIFEIDSLLNGCLRANDYSSKRLCIEQKINSIEFEKKSSRIQDKKPKISLNLSHTKTKKCFVRLYKKCKSTSNITIERSSTALCKITNLDHFFQALGSGKLLSSVFGGYAEKKILSSIAEMRNWITDISQRQAMLVLLLTNKKETPNLVRYRPVLLQGIAVNRITRASELDMEIEVIETENLKKPQFDGIPYMSTKDQTNNLLEELYWIAKTTASDYQKPFDESSERLLKSLTEKRKKLNPSYLRVMARYVGLGLLKPPKKCIFK